MVNIRKDSIKYLKKLEKVFPGDSLINDKGPATIGAGEETFKLLKKLERSGLISAIGYKTEGLPEEKVLQSPIITSKGIDFLNGLKQNTTNTILIILTFLMAITSITQIILLIKSLTS